MKDYTGFSKSREKNEDIKFNQLQQYGREGLKISSLIRRREYSLVLGLGERFNHTGKFRLNVKLTFNLVSISHLKSNCDEALTSVEYITCSASTSEMVG